MRQTIKATISSAHCVNDLINPDKGNMNGSIDLNSRNDSEDCIVTLSSNRGNYKSSNTESISKSHDVQRKRKLPEMNNKRIFIFGDSILKHLKGCKKKDI